MHATFTGENRGRRRLYDEYRELVLERQSDGVDKYAEEMVAEFADALLRDGRTVARAFGGGGWIPADVSEPYATFAELVKDAALACRENRPVLISDENHNGAMLGNSALNLAFRAHHDACHVLGYEGFSLHEEARVALDQIVRLSLNTPRNRAAALVCAEVIGQGLHFDETGCFPLDCGRQPFIPYSPELLDWVEDCFAFFCGFQPHEVE